MIFKQPLHGGDETTADTAGFSHYLRSEWAKAQVFFHILVPGINAGVT